MSNVQVAVRARPLNKRELGLESSLVVEMRDKSTTLFKTVDGVAVGQTRDDSKEFKYDHSFWSVDPLDMHFVTQDQVYSSLGKSVLESAFQGYNACVFAYGQTGSGKTYTMMGSEESPGLIPKICENLFARTAAGHLKKVSYRVEASYMEIYNEKVGDLLEVYSGSGSPHQHHLKVREHPKDGPYVEHLSKHLVSDYAAIHQLMKKGNSQRVTASTKMNDTSSRSHAIFTLVFTQAVYTSDLPCETVSKIHLVDLAGSERASATGAEGIRLKEGGNINKSLACLGNVISALADMSSCSGRQKKPYIPYRDSVLTWLLKDSLGGNSKTIMIATISPADVCYGESLSTLRYASRAKNIVNKPIVNEDPNVKLIRELRAEIKRLKNIITSGNIEDTRERSGSHLLAEHIHKKEEQIAELTKSWAGKWTDIGQLLEESNLEVHTEGIKMTVGTERPHFLALDDLSATGVVLYQLQDGETTVGSRECMSPPDIVLNASDIQPRHCVVHYTDGLVELTKRDGDCYVNTQDVTESKQLSHGDIVQFGQSTMFRFYNPCQTQASVEDVSRTKYQVLSASSFTNLSSKESEKERLEKEFNERLNTFREELERKNEEEKAALYEQLEFLKQQQTLRASESIMESDAYHVMQSVGMDISSRVVVGEETNHGYLLSFHEDDELPKNCSSTPVSKSQHSDNDSDSHQLESSSSFVNILSESEKADVVDPTHSSSSGTETEQVDSAMGTLSVDPTVNDSEKEELKKQVEDLQTELRKKELVDQNVRRRSYAFGEIDSPRLNQSHFKRRTRSMRSITTAVVIDIPDVFLRGSGFSSYHVYVVKIELGHEHWKVFKSYNQFCHLHGSLKAKYPELSSLSLPPSKWLRVKNLAFVEQRRKDLKVYLQSLLAICMNLEASPLYDPMGRRLSKKRLIKLSTFFDGGSRDI